MKRKITLLLFCSVLVTGLLAQKPTATIFKASVAPTVDGQVDEVWAEAEAEHDIVIQSTDEPATLGDPGETTWQALWTDEGIYVLLRVTDDAFYPHYIGGGNSWEFDKPELYFDVNYILIDGIGPSSNEGHYQVAPAFADGSNDGTLLTCGFNGTEGSIVEYAFDVADPDYIAEYFVPFQDLISSEGIAIDLTEPVGFDVTIIDRDPTDNGGRAAVWSNNSDIGSSWVNMDDCGIILFDGAEAGIYIEEITLTGGDITENNGTLQIEATILPEDATNKSLAWSVVNGTGKASVDENGMVTGIIDGDVSVVAASKDGSYMEASTVVTISNQIVTRGEINLFRNGYFDDVNEDNTPAEWNPTGNTTVVEGVCVIDPDEGANVWDFRLQQQGGWGLNTADFYVFSFVLLSDDPDTFNVDFEDARAEVGYHRYGVSDSEFATDGTSDWTFQSPTAKTRYVFDVNFPDLLDESNEQFQFMLGHHDPTVYIDSVELININDLEKLTPGYIPVTEIVLSGGDAVEVDASLQMAAVAAPSNATLTEVRWSVVNGTGEATVDETGLVTGVADGLVTVVATAKDDSKVTGVMDVTVGTVGISQQSVETLRLYPNPAVNELNVVLTSKNTSVSIYNAVGQRMEQLVVSGTEYKFDISSYAAGIYFVKTETAIAKFVK